MLRSNPFINSIATSLKTAYLSKHQADPSVILPQSNRDDLLKKRQTISTQLNLGAASSDSLTPKSDQVTFSGQKNQGAIPNVKPSKVIKYVQSIGCTVDLKGGKGDHMKIYVPGHNRPVTMQNNTKDVSLNVAQSLAKALNKSLKDLRTELVNF